MRSTIKFAALLFIAMLHVSASAKDKSRVPRLPDGKPDLQGVWDHSNATPLERLPGYATLTIAPADANALSLRLRAEQENPNIPTDPNGELVVRQLEPIRDQYRSSMIVDPPNGLIPGNGQFKSWQASIQFHVLNTMDGPEARPASERCLGNPASQPPILYNPGMNLHQIVQTSDSIVFYSEWGHDARVIRINGKHAPAQVTSWLGDSIGWWEGDTLVIETKNFAPSDPGRVVRSINYKLSSQATVIERFKRISATQLDYSFTVDDPINYTQPWRGETHFVRSNEAMFEYACHEGNYAMENILRAARVLEESAQGRFAEQE